MILLGSLWTEKQKRDRGMLPSISLQSGVERLIWLVISVWTIRIEFKSIQICTRFAEGAWTHPLLKKHKLFDKFRTQPNNNISNRAQNISAYSHWWSRTQPFHPLWEEELVNSWQKNWCQGIPPGGSRPPVCHGTLISNSYSFFKDSPLFLCASVFSAMSNTSPVLWSSASDFFLFVTGCPGQLARTWTTFGALKLTNKQTLLWPQGLECSATVGFEQAIPLRTNTY